MAKKVFFSFHYQDVIDFRANVVRNHWISKDDRESAGYYDRSIWEKAKKEGDIALKRMINKSLENTSNTAVLVGSETYARPWVRYEILKSFLRGNYVLAVNINSFKDKHGEIKRKGPNPLEYVAATFSADGKTVTLSEFLNGNWVNYTRIENKASHPCVPKLSAGHEGKWIKLSSLFPSYDWKNDNGYDNFGSWLK